MKSLLATSATFGLLCFPAFAQTTDCENASSQLEMNECAERSFQAADAELNSTYNTLKQQVTEAGLVKLKSAERAWNLYRDAQCAFESAGTQDGSVHAMVASSCREGLTRAQTKRLAAQLNCEEGDASCGGQ